MSDTIYRQTVLRCIKESRDNIDWGQSEDGDAFLHYTGALYRTIASEECVPSAEHIAHIGDFTQYQIAWLTEHDDLELEPELESWVIRFLKDTADCYEKEYLTSAERTGHWIHQTQYNRIQCSVCETVYRNTFAPKNFCPNCGADMRGEEDDSR